MGHRHERGFTLLELMAVVLIMGTILLLVPINLDSVGAEGKLKNSANSLVAAFNGARERAVLDSYEVWLEFGSYQEEDADDWRQGWRFKFTSLPPPEVTGGDDPNERDRKRADRAREREWLYTGWHATPSGVEIVGVSAQKGSWNKVQDSGKPIGIRFLADGTVENGVAIRIENTDMPVSREYRTITVMLNGLTSEANWVEGLGELSESLPASNFGN
ncbi:MAG: GspH/FimT family pseudopilin [Planctomycetota bacterium]|nr:GspH/FimT family pseudopilin [Planctomycetota bacterium]